MVARLIILLLVVIGLSSLSFHPSLADIGRETGLPIPRFVSLNKDKVYLRAGPGRRYPIDWVFKRQNLILGERCGILRISKAGCIKACFRAEDG